MTATDPRPRPSFRRPRIAVQHSAAGRVRGAEVLLRLATGAMFALVASLLWIISLPVDTDTKAWCVVIGSSAIMAVCAFLGASRAEGNKTRAMLARLASVGDRQRADIIDMLSSNRGHGRRRGPQSGRRGTVPAGKLADRDEAWMNDVAKAVELGRQLREDEGQ